MNREKVYRVPDILDIIYEDVLHGLYTTLPKSSMKSRIKLAKFNLACDLLINTKVNEEEILKKLDFGNIDEFRYLFEGYLGITPLKFRSRFSN